MKSLDNLEALQARQRLSELENKLRLGQETYHNKVLETV